jgi:hypothetical protein
MRFQKSWQAFPLFIQGFPTIPRARQGTLYCGISQHYKQTNLQNRLSPMGPAPLLD